jgi:signal peptidase I
VSDDIRTDDAGPRRDSGASALRQIVEFLLTLLVAYLIAQGVRAWVVSPYVVPTGSMLPTIQLNDMVLANKFVYRFQSPKRGDIVVLDDPTGQHGTLIKRTIATAGQTVDLRNGKVIIDGKALPDPYAHGQPSDPLPGSQVVFPFKVPAGDIWVMGDNRTNSADSRWFGPVPLSSVHGRAFFTYWPVSRFGPLN